MDDVSKRTLGWQRQVFAILWTSYASYYLCRMNFSAAKPEILHEFAGWTKGDIGLIESVYLLCYATGQFVNGQIGTRVGARRMLAMGLVAIGVCNLLFASTSSYALMLALWAVNGYCQSTGWPMVVQTMSSWFRVARRGSMMGLISTCYQVGNVSAWLLGGWLVSDFGWRAAFWVPGLALLPVAALALAGLRNRPEDAGLGPIRDDTAPEGPDAGTVEDWSLGRILRTTLQSRVLWILALSYFCFNSVRYAFMNWGIQYFADFHGQEVKSGAFMAVAFPLIGALGAVSSGWASDRFFHGRRAPVCAIMLLLLGGACLLFIPIPKGAVLEATALLGLAGFLIYGPDAILTGAAAIDLAHPRAAAAATGFIMATGNFGSAIFSGAGVGHLLDEYAGSWTPVFVVLTVLSVLAALMSALLWNQKPKPRTR